MSTHANMVKMTVTSVSATPETGKGTITLNAASTGFQSFADAYGGNATVDILITKGAEWEVARDCTYTHSGTTVTRGTWEDSSNGTGAIVADNTATVSVVATAAFGNNAALNHVAASPTTAGVTGVVGTMHLLDISGLTASRNFTLPATAAVGDRVGVFLTTGDAAFGLIIIGDTGDTINGGSANTAWGILIATGECVILRCITANAAWVVESAILSPCVVSIGNALNTSQGSFNNNSFTKIAAALDSETSNPAGWWDAANDKFLPNRSGAYHISCAVQLQGAAPGTIYQATLYKNGTAIKYGSTVDDNGAVITIDAIVSLNGSTDYVELYVYVSNSTGVSTLGSAANRTSFIASYLGT